MHLEMSNPFFNRDRIRDPHYFVGRNSELRKIARAIQTSQALSIVGPRRIGKSSLLTHIIQRDVRKEYDIDSRYRLVYIDCQAWEKEAPVGLIYQMLIESILEEDEPQSLAQVVNFSEFRRVVNRITQQQGNLVFLLDEFEALASIPALKESFFSQLRSLSQTHNVTYITASHRPLHELAYSDEFVLSSPFFNIFSSLHLGLMSDEEAKRLVDTLLIQSSSGMVFNETDFQWVHRCAGTHPLFIQIASDLLFEAKVMAQAEQYSTGQIATRLSSTDIRNLLTERFDLEEIKILINDLGYKHDDIAGKTKASKCRDFVSRVQREGRTGELIDAVMQKEHVKSHINSLMLPSSSPHHVNYQSLEREFLQQAEQHFTYIWEQLSSSLRETVYRICTNDSSDLFPDVQETLEEKCLLTDGRIFSEVFAKFVIKQKENEQKEMQGDNHKTKLEIVKSQKTTMQISGELTPAQRLVARQIFEEQGIESAVFTKLAGGYANLGIYRVEAKPYGEPRALRSQVLKFASAKDIRREKDDFANLVKDKLGIAAWHSATYWFPPDFAQLPIEEWHHEVAAALYTFAQTSGEATVTFQQLYQQPGLLGAATHEAQVRTVYKMLLDSLDKWQTFVQPQQPLTSLRDAYRRLGSMRHEIQKHALDLPELGLAHLADGDVGYLQRTEKVIWRGEEYTNPIYWMQQLFGADEEPAWLKALSGSCYMGLVHGDLNSRNILVEQDEGQARKIWLIDFADTHEGHVLRDYGTLEAELKIFLTQIDDTDFSGGLQPILELEKFLLEPELRDEIDLDNRELPERCRQNLKLERMTNYIRLLRGRAKEKYMPTIDVRPYYLSLLHATLPIVYYSQLSKWQRLYAFLSAAMICEKIDQLAFGAEKRPFVSFFKTADFEVNDYSEQDYFSIKHGLGRWRKLGEMMVFVYDVKSGSEPATIRDFFKQAKRFNPSTQLIYFAFSSRLTKDVILELWAIRQKENFAIIPLDVHTIEQTLLTSRNRNDLLEKLIIWQDEWAIKSDPYATINAGSSPQWFFGKLQLQIVENVLQGVEDGGRCFLIYGMRRIGKTTLLHQLVLAFREKQFLVAYLVMKKLGEDAGYQSVLQDIIHKWTDGLGKTTEISVDEKNKLATMPFEQAAFSLVNLAAQKRGIAPKFIVVMDEADAIFPKSEQHKNEYEAVVNLLQSFKSIIESPDNTNTFALVVAAEYQWINKTNFFTNSEEFQNPLYLRFKSNQMVRLLEKEGHDEMVQTLGALAGLEYTPASLERLHFYSGGHPEITRKLCSCLFELRQEQQIGNDIDTDQINKALASFFENPDAFAYYLKASFWNNPLSVDLAWEKRIISQLAEYGTLTARELNDHLLTLYQSVLEEQDQIVSQEVIDQEKQLLEKVLERLLDLQIIESSSLKEENPRYTIRIPLYREWVRSQILGEDVVFITQ